MKAKELKNKKEKQKKETTIFSKFHLTFKTFIWVLSFFLALESFAFKTPYSVSVGFLFMLYFILLNPFFDKMTEKIKVHLTIKQKVFVAITTFLSAAYSIKTEETNFYRCLISILIMLLLYVITFIYSKIRSNKKASS